MDQIIDENGEIFWKSTEYCNKILAFSPDLTYFWEGSRTRANKRTLFESAKENECLDLKIREAVKVAENWVVSGYQFSYLIDTKTRKTKFLGKKMLIPSASLDVLVFRENYDTFLICDKEHFMPMSIGYAKDLTFSFACPQGNLSRDEVIDYEGNKLQKGIAFYGGIHTGNLLWLRNDSTIQMLDAKTLQVLFKKKLPWGTWKSCASDQGIFVFQSIRGMFAWQILPEFKELWEIPVSNIEKGGSEHFLFIYDQIILDCIGNQWFKRDLLSGKVLKKGNFEWQADFFAFQEGILLAISSDKFESFSFKSKVETETFKINKSINIKLLHNFGHFNSIKCSVLSADQKFLASLSEPSNFFANESTLCIWCTQTGRMLNKIRLVHPIENENQISWHSRFLAVVQQHKILIFNPFEKANTNDGFFEKNTNPPLQSVELPRNINFKEVQIAFSEYFLWVLADFGNKKLAKIPLTGGHWSVSDYFYVDIPQHEVVQKISSYHNQIKIQTSKTYLVDENNHFTLFEEPEIKNNWVLKAKQLISQENHQVLNLDKRYKKVYETTFGLALVQGKAISFLNNHLDFLDAHTFDWNRIDFETDPLVLGERDLGEKFSIHPSFPIYLKVENQEFEIVDLELATDYCWGVCYETGILVIPSFLSTQNFDNQIQWIENDKVIKKNYEIRFTFEGILSAKDFKRADKKLQNLHKI